MFNIKDSGLTRMNLSRQHQNWSFREERLCWLYGGIIMVLLIRSFKVQSDTQCNVCMKVFRENNHHSSIRKMCFHDKAKPHWARSAQDKYRLACSILSTIHTWWSSKWFKSFSFYAKCSKCRKIYWRSGENICGKLPKLETSWILLSNMINCMTWFKIMANCISFEINCLLDNSWTNYIFLKRYFCCVDVI